MPAPSTLRQQRDHLRRKKTKKQLLKAAVRVFDRRGYHGTLISDIVAEAGVGQGTFYRNFQSKREIFETLVDGFISEFFEEFSEMSANLPSDEAEYREASLAAILRVAHIVERNRKLCRVFLREAPTIDREIAGVIRTTYGRMADLARFYLDHAIAQGFARPCRSDVVARSIVGMGVHMVEAWLHGELPDLPPEELVTEVVNYSFHGLTPPRDGRGEQTKR